MKCAACGHVANVHYERYRECDAAYCECRMFVAPVEASGDGIGEAMSAVVAIGEMLSSSDSTPDASPSSSDDSASADASSDSSSFDSGGGDFGGGGASGDF